MASDHDAAVRQQLIELITGGNAHAEFKKAIEDFPPELRGKRPKGSPHSPWELLEHMRIAQWDILEFSRNSKHVCGLSKTRAMRKRPVSHATSRVPHARSTT